MNYYSRSSPRKHKAQHEPGFLIPRRTPSSGPSLSRSRLRPHFNLSSRHSLRSHEDPQEAQQQILVLDGGILYVPAADEILIQQSDHPNSLQQPLISQADEELAQDAQQPNSFATASNQRDSMPESMGSGDQELNKYFYRNYSFGSKEFAKSQDDGVQGRKQPLIRQMINMQSLPKLENRSRANKDTLVEKALESQTTIHRSLKGRVKSQQSWSKMVRNFIQKRKSEQENRNEPESMKANIQLHKQNQVQELQSHNSGYFRVIEQKIEDEPMRQKEIFFDRLTNNQIKIEDEQLPLLPLDQKKKQKRQQEQNGQNSKPQRLQESQEPRGLQKKFFATTVLLQKTIEQLPQQIASKFIQIKKERDRKIHEAQITTSRMEEIQAMVKLLIVAHKRMLYVDRLVLDGSLEQESMEEQVVANQEIIFSLVRKLGCYY